MTRSKKSEIKADAPQGASPSYYLDEVYEAYRRNHHFNLKLTQEKIYAMSLAEVQKYSILVAEEAFKTYNAKGNPRPHPNYFMAICRRLHKDGFTPEPKQHLGKTI